MTTAALLATGIAQMGLSVPEQMQLKLLQYLALLQKWNKVYNLTAVRQPEEMVTLHLLDSLSILPYLCNQNLLDVGSGAGLPGIVVAICMPELAVTTIDTVQKKAIFMRQVKGELGLENLTVMHARVENYQPVTPFAQIISRAFSDIALLMHLTKHLIAKDGRWLAMKGLIPSHELVSLPSQSIDIIPLKVANLTAERHLIVINHDN